MSPIRSLTWLAGALAALGILLALPTAGPDLIAAPGDLLAWWEREGTAAAAIGLLHLAALAAAAYTTLVLAAITTASLLRLPATLMGPLVRLAPRTIRRHLLAGLVVGTLALPATASAQDSIVLVDLGDDVASSAPITLVDLGPATDDSPDELATRPGPDPASIARDSVASLGAPDHAVGATTAAGFRPAPTAEPVADAWLVEDGDNLWTIAESVVAERLGEAPDDATISAYWRELITANGSIVADPDLIHPGQVLTLPAGASAQG